MYLQKVTKEKLPAFEEEQCLFKKYIKPTLELNIGVFDNVFSLYAFIKFVLSSTLFSSLLDLFLIVLSHTSQK